MRELRRVLLIGAGVFAASVLVTLVVLLARRTPSAATAGGEVPSAVEAPLRTSDFILPRRDVTEGAIYRPYRDRLQVWEREQVDHFWVPLEDIVQDILREESDRAVEELLHSVD